MNSSTRISLVTPVLLLSTAVFGHERVNLDHKVHMSDIVLIGTVTATEGVVQQSWSFDPSETASRVAIIHVEEMLKGHLDERTITVGFETDYDDEEENASIHAIAISCQRAPKTGQWWAGENRPF